MTQSGKESTYSAGDAGAIPGLGRSPGEGNGKPRHYSCLGNPMDPLNLGATVHEITRARHNLVTKPRPPPVMGTQRSATSSFK